MTPEERATKAWDDACRDYQENKAVPYLAAAIRAAENDALERVYNSLMDQADAHSNPERAGMLRYAAFFALFGCTDEAQDRICSSRALKHKEAT
jgi:hypothetical protein